MLPPLLTTDRLLDDPEAARAWLSGLGVRDPERGFRDLRDLARRGVSGTLMARLAGRLHALLPGCPDPGMALTNLERFVSACPNPAAVVASLVRDTRTAEIAVQWFSTSQYFSELMIRDPSLLDWVRSGAERRDGAALAAEIGAGLAGARDEEERRLILRKARHREMLRIGYDDIIGDRPLEEITHALSQLADACVEAACRSARAAAEERHGVPLTSEGTPARFVVLGLGKLGGEELNYSSDIDLIFLYDDEGQTTGPRGLSNAEFFARMGGEIVRLLSDHTAQGQAYRVDMRLRPEGDQGPLARSLAATLRYYEAAGRTWERQMLIKCRPLAGDRELGREFLEAIAPFVYRRSLASAEIAEIQAVKRRIEARTESAGDGEFEVKTGRGGIRDVEFVVQFLQLLHGGRHPEVRHPNTLAGIARLESLGALTAEERGILEDSYRFLRRVEHRLQTMFDRQTHTMPRNPEEQRTLAIRLGYAPRSVWEDRIGPAQRFLADYRARAEENRRILNHLLHDAFCDDAGAPADPAVDLVLDPAPDPDRIAAVLGSYPFRDVPAANRNLLALAREDDPSRSEARCRHFLAAIAPRLLRALARTPDPDAALANLVDASAETGSRAALWGRFHASPPTLRRFVEQCATSPDLPPAHDLVGELRRP